MENDLVAYDKLVQRPRRRRAAGAWRMIKGQLSEKSATYAAIATAVHRIPVLRRQAIDCGLIIENLAGMRKNTFSQRINDISVKKLRDLIRPYDAWILIIPSRGLWVGNNVHNEQRVHRRFVSSMRRPVARVIDARDTFEADGNPLRFHFARDGHWNPKGHRRAAKILTAAIESGSAGFLSATVERV